MPKAISSKIRDGFLTWAMAAVKKAPGSIGRGITQRYYQTRFRSFVKNCLIGENRAFDEIQDVSMGIDASLL